MNIRSTLTRGLAALAVGAMALTLGTSPATAALPETEPTAAALDWLTNELSDAGVLEGSFDDGQGGRIEYVDHGTTIDAALAAAYLGRADEARAAADALEPVIGDYMGFGPGSYAKALALATAVGADVADFGGFDLVAGTESAITEDGPTAGRLLDDFVNAFSQALAARGLTAVGSPKAGSALAYLLQQQCPGGGFPLYFPAVDAPQGCDSDDSADPDATGFVVTQLVGNGFGPAVRARVQEAVDWLTSQQAADGSLSSEGAANSNSTGLAGWALGASCHIAAAQAAGPFVRSLQVPADEPADSALAGDAGAIAFTADSLARGRQDGIDDDNNFEWRKATSQAAPALQWLPDRTTSLRVGGEPGYKRAGSRVDLSVTGAAAGETFCVEGPALHIARTGAVQGAQTVTVRLPSTTGDYTYTVSDGPGSSDQLVKVLGPTTLNVRAPFRKRQGTKMRVTASGLASGEIAKLFVSRDDVRTAYANRDGRVIFRGVDVARAPGKRKYVVRGKFSRIRKGSDVVRVLPSR